MLRAGAKAALLLRESGRKWNPYSFKYYFGGAGPGGVGRVAGCGWELSRKAGGATGRVRGTWARRP